VSGTVQGKAEWVERVLGVTLGDSAAQGQVDPERQRRQRAMAALEPSLLDAVRAAPDERTRLMSEWGQLHDQVTSGDGGPFDQALGAMRRRIEGILALGPKSDTEKFGIREGIVAERRAELESYFAQQMEYAKIEALDEVDKLTEHLDEIIEDADDLVSAIAAQVVDLFDQFRPAVASVLRSGEAADVAKAISDWRGSIESEPRIAELHKAAAVFGCGTDLEAVIERLVRDALKEAATLDG
jgi:hypothetical protein